jgi:serine/threonine protein kinase
MRHGEESVRPGDVLAGKYRVERVLGAGAMGVVVSAQHVELGELRAVKLLRGSLLSEPVLVERFLREARAVVRLKSEHVAHVYDVGRQESGAPFIVLEHLEGADLAKKLQREGPMPLDELAGVLLQVCEALSEAHSLGIVHRDLKPANLFLAEGRGGRTVKVLDFGISKLVADESSEGGHELTDTSVIVGSPSFMAPEQVRSSRTVDHRADIWSLGVIFYQLATGELPFRAPEKLELLLKIIQDVPRPPSELRGDLPPEVDRIVLRCLEKRPDRRYASVGELAADLAPLTTSAETSLLLSRISRHLGEAPRPSAPTPARLVEPARELSSSDAIARPARIESSTASGPRPDVDAASASGTQASWANGELSRPRTSGRSRAPLFALGAAVVAAAGLGAFFALRGPSSGPAAAVSTGERADAARTSAPEVAVAPTQAASAAPTTSASAAPSEAASGAPSEANVEPTSGPKGSPLRGVGAPTPSTTATATAATTTPPKATATAAAPAATSARPNRHDF